MTKMATELKQWDPRSSPNVVFAQVSQLSGLVHLASLSVFHLPQARDTNIHQEEPSFRPARRRCADCRPLKYSFSYGICCFLFRKNKEQKRFCNVSALNLVSHDKGTLKEIRQQQATTAKATWWQELNWGKTQTLRSALCGWLMHLARSVPPAGLHTR